MKMEGLLQGQPKCDLLVQHSCCQSMCLHMMNGNHGFSTTDKGTVYVYEA
mgnify:CR=1 FL=1